ncbi:hypothetical protein BN14_08508 [Rhizoctonia solani AG-1 IB]|uniref:Uncharacterized protein n=1 Tax=Thanatephorus cucumeris (strain AG1-IB / isolate 7/3/14) TaxID=1108050 RepID=M5C5N7_THACB|nr:hypothetical protein BN14_08508 [Rhizoctonia solani AG-1 IB]
MAPETLPPQTVTSHIAFSRHARTESYSDSELDFDSARAKPKLTRHQHVKSTQTAVAWRCGSGNHEKCCGTRSLQQGHNIGQFKCCVERTPSGKVARCCASYVGMPCERPRVSSTSSASVSDLKRQRSAHLPGPAAHPSAAGNGGKRKGFFRPHTSHTSHGKSTSSARIDEDIRATILSKPSGEDLGPQSPTLEGCVSVASVSVASPPTSPVGKQEFHTRPIISPSKLNGHLKETLVAAVPASIVDPIKSPKLGPMRGRSDTTTTTATTTDTSTSASVRSVLTNQSDDCPAPMKQLHPPRRRNQNVSLPTMTTTQSVPPPRRYVQSITTVVQPSGTARPLPPPRSPISGIGLSSLSTGPGLPPPPRVVHGRTSAQPIVSFISSRSAPTPTPTPANVGLRHRSSRESYESSRTVRRERSIPLLRERSFLEFEEGVSEEDEEDLVEPQQGSEWVRPALQQTQSFLDLSSRQSGDTMRENMAMFS